MNSTFRLPALYPIVNVADASEAARERALALAIELAAAGAELLQLRAKPLAAGDMAQLTTRMLHALRGSPALLLVNDRADVAAACGADGVHVGDEDLPVGGARLVLSRSRVGEERRNIVGFSTHSVAEVVAASRTTDPERACLPDYLGFGPVFESPTKAGVRDARGLELLTQACLATTLPVVAIGGVNLERASDCFRAGAASVAVISEIERSRNLPALVAAYRRAASEANRSCA